MKTPEEIETAEDAKLDDFLKTKREDNRLVTVCDACHMASCWRGIFMCDKAAGAGTVRMPVHHLRDLGLEHSDYYAASDDYPEPDGPACGCIGCVECRCCIVCDPDSVGCPDCNPDI